MNINRISLHYTAWQNPQYHHRGWQLSFLIQLHISKESSAAENHVNSYICLCCHLVHSQCYCLFLMRHGIFTLLSVSPIYQWRWRGVYLCSKVKTFPLILLITSLEIGLCSISCIAGTVKQTWYKMNQASKCVFFISKWIQVHFWECTNSALIVLLGFFLWDKFSSSAVWDWVTCIISFGLGYMFSTSHVK